ncbi:MAG: TolB family protein, partial [Anaerolineales bacterium]
MYMPPTRKAGRETRLRRLLIAMGGLNLVLLVIGGYLLWRLSHREPAPTEGNAPVAVATPDLSTAAPDPPTAIAYEQEIAVTAVTPTAGPSPTPPVNPFDVGGTIAIALRRNGHTNLWALEPGNPTLTRLTAGPWDDRDPAWSRDGAQLAFASNRAGSWDIYVLDIATGALERVTRDPGYEGHPSWSPDGIWLTYEGYAADNFDIYIVKVAGEQPIRLTTNPAADFGPTWSPAGRKIAFISYRAGEGPDLFTFDLDVPDEDASAERFTFTPDTAEHNPLWSPDARLLMYTDLDSPLRLVFVKDANDPLAPPRDVAQGQFPIWTPDGTGVMTAFNQADRQFLAAAALGAWGAAPVAAPIEGLPLGMSWSDATLPKTLSGTLYDAQLIVDAPAWQPVVTRLPRLGGDEYELASLDQVRAPFPLLSDRVDESFEGLRLRMIAEAGWDFLSVLDNAYIPVDQPQPPGQGRESWNVAGRAFDISQAAFNDGWVYVVREDAGTRTFWQVWVRTAQADGTLGEPLHVRPWNFNTRFSGDPTAYDNGGSFLPEPPRGYFVNFTLMGQDYGWTRTPAADNWRTYFPGILYWHFEHRGGLTWEEAMQELYSPGQIASATPFQSPTFTASATGPPTATGTVTPTVTATA